MALIDELLKPRTNPFPTNAAGALINPPAIQAEGQRMAAGFADGSLGGPNVAISGPNGDVTNYKPYAPPGTPPGLITVAPNSRADEAAASIAAGWNQDAWNQNPSQQRENLNLDILRTTAAQRKFDLEQGQKNAPVLDAYAQAKLNHENAATAAIGATHLRQVQKDTSTMAAVTNFEKAMLTAGEPGTAEYDANVRNAIAKNPAILMTKYGMQHIPNIAKEHDLAAKAKALQTKTDASEFKSTYGFPASAIQQSTVQVGNYDPATKTLKQDNKGTHVSVTTPAGKKAVMTTQAYEANGGKYSGETAAARASAPTLPSTPVQVKTIDEANALPAGTVFLDPNGKLKRKP